MYVHVHTYIYIYTHTYIYIYVRLLDLGSAFSGLKPRGLGVHTRRFLLVRGFPGHEFLWVEGGSRGRRVLSVFGVQGFVFES